MLVLRLFRIACSTLALAGIIVSSGQAMANPWLSALGDARAVQRKTEDIAERLNQHFPFSSATDVALHLDNAACQLVESVKCGSSWEQLQGAFHRTCALAEQLNAMTNEDCNVRNDRRTRDYINELAKRMERLRCSLDKAYAKTQPVFCPPAIHSRFHGHYETNPAQPLPYGNQGSWNHSLRDRMQPSRSSF